MELLKERSTAEAIYETCALSLSWRSGQMCIDLSESEDL